MPGALVVRELITTLGYDIDSKDLKTYNKQLGSVGGVLKGVGKAALAAGAALAAVATGAFAKKLVDVNLEFEALMGQLKTATGGLDAAKEKFAELEQCRASDALFLYISNAQARQLNYYPVFTLLLNIGLGYPQWVNPI